MELPIDWLRCPICGGEIHDVVDRDTATSPPQEAEGTDSLACANCRAEFPVIDGLPFLVPDLQQLMSDQGWAVWARRDLPLATQQMLSSRDGAGSAADSMRQQLSCYAWDHYGDGTDSGDREDARPGGIVSLLERTLSRCTEPLAGPILDVGCSVGRSSFELARRCETSVVGLDLNVGMLRLAREVAETGRVRYLCRRSGHTYAACDFAAPDVEGLDVSFVLADALAIPFADATFRSVVALNVLDCVRSAGVLLENLSRVLTPGGTLVITTPFDWQPGSTPESEWLGSRDGENDPAQAFRGLVEHVTEARLAIMAEEPAIPWRVRLHDRSVMEYQTHLFLIRKNA